MTQATGANSTLFIGSELVAYNTVTTGVGRIVPFGNINVGVNQNTVNSKVIKATRDASRPGLGNYGVSIKLDTELNAFMHHLFAHLLGDDTVTGVADPYLHTVLVADMPTSFSLGLILTDLQSANRMFQYTGCRINSASLKWTSDGVAELSFDILGSTETVQAIPGSGFGFVPVSVGDHVPFTGLNMTAANTKIGSAGGTARAILQEVSIDIKNNLDGNVYIIGGAGKRVGLPQGVIEVTGMVKAILDDTAYTNLYAIAAAGTPSGLNFKFLYTDPVSATARSCNLVLYEVIWGRSPLTISGSQGVYVEFPFTAYYADTASAKTTMQAIFENSDSVAGESVIV